MRLAVVGASRTHTSSVSHQLLLHSGCTGHPDKRQCRGSLGVESRASLPNGACELTSCSCFVESMVVRTIAAVASCCGVHLA